MFQNNSVKWLGLLSAGLALVLSACSSDNSKMANSSQTKSYTLVEAAYQTKQSGPLEPELVYNDFSSVHKAQQLSLQQGYEYEGQFTPYQGSSSRIYGSTAAGCIEGANELSDHNSDFQLQRWANDRNYAHPIMLQYLEDLRARTSKLGLPPLLIGDLSRSLGGPYGPTSNHASHNTGIDVDLPFDFALPRKTDKELRSPKDVYIVKGSTIQPAFTKSIEVYIKTAASDPRVDRIFVAPMIKKQMCLLYEKQANNGFLQKLRPWFGHQAHMHVRLKCPFDSPNCVSQAPVPQGTGCGYELESWFLPPPPSSKTAKATPTKKKRILPQKCTLLLKEYEQQTSAK